MMTSQMKLRQAPATYQELGWIADNNCVVVSENKEN